MKFEENEEFETLHHKFPLVSFETPIIEIKREEKKLDARCQEDIKLCTPA
jgi:hypothetical protein